MNNPSYLSASVFPLLQTGMMNVYLDIELFFQYLNQEFNNRGSLRFERMKASFIQQSSDIATTAHRLAAQVFIPMVAVRPNAWNHPLSVIESEKLRDMVYYIHRSIAEVSVRPVPSSLVLEPFERHRPYSSEHDLPFQRYTERVH